MRLSIKSQYGLQALLELAQSFARAEKRIGEIAKSQKIPARFLEQILLILKRSGLLASSRGKLGGYALARSADKITLGEIIEAIEGPIQLIPRRGKKASVVSEILLEIESGLRESLETITLEDMVMRERRRKGEILYHI